MNNKNKYIVIAIALIAVIGIATIVLSEISDNRITGFSSPFGKQTVTATLDEVPIDVVTLEFSARVLTSGTSDIFPAYVSVNQDGWDYCENVGGRGKWDGIVVRDTEFHTYSVDLPVDIDNDGLVDWKQGVNTVVLWTQSSYHSGPTGKMEIEWIEFSVP